MREAVGLVETVGKVAAVVAMDAAVKAAAVTLTGLENSRGGGRMTVKLTGEVSAVKAAVEAAMAAVTQYGGTVYAHKVIASPSDPVEGMLEKTGGKRDETRWYVWEETPAEEIDVPDRAAAPIAAPPVPDVPKETAVPSAESPTAPTPPPVEQASCNLCGDPRCPRTRGEARTKCIHYFDLQGKPKKEQEEKK